MYGLKPVPFNTGPSSGCPFALQNLKHIRGVVGFAARGKELRDGVQVVAGGYQCGLLVWMDAIPPLAAGLAAGLGVGLGVADVGQQRVAQAFPAAGIFEFGRL